MLIVLGHISVQPDKMAEALRVSQEHVERSRSELGCLEHGVHRSTEDPNRLVFVERWLDLASLQEHFALRESVQMVRSLAAMATDAPSISICNAEQVQFNSKNAG